MFYDKIPSYEELKKIKEEYTFSLYYPLIGGYFRIKLNEDCMKNIAIDYLEGGYLAYINRNFKSKFRFSHLYKFNKKNYEGLVKLYKEMLNILLEETKIVLSKMNELEGKDKE